MTMNRLLLGLAVALVLVVAVGSVDAELLQFRGSGSFLAGGTPIDANGDGITADLFLTTGTSAQLGSVANQSVVEWQFGPPTTCPPGTVLQGTLVPAGSAYVSRAVNGDLLFGTYTSGTNCFDGTAARLRSAGIISGGTGRFAGATGTFTVRATATPLLPSAQFGSVVAEGELTIIK